MEEQANNDEARRSAGSAVIQPRTVNKAFFDGYSCLWIVLVTLQCCQSVGEYTKTDFKNKCGIWNLCTLSQVQFLSWTCNFAHDLYLVYKRNLRFENIDWKGETNGGTAGVMTSGLCFPSVILLVFG